MQHSWLRLMVCVAVCAGSAEVHAAKKAAKKAATAANHDDSLTVGLSCVLKEGVAAKPAKKGKATKLAKGSKVKILEVGASVRLKTEQGEVLVKRAALQKICQSELAVAPPEPLVPAPTPAPAAVAPSEKPPAAPAAAAAPAKAQPVAIAPAPREEASPVRASALADPVRAQKASRARTLRALAITFTVVGAAGIGTGGVFTALGLMKAATWSKQVDEYNNKTVRTQAEHDQIRADEAVIGTYRNVAIATGAVGVAALATGIILFAVGENPKQYEDVASLRLTPQLQLNPGGASFGLSGTF